MGFMYDIHAIVYICSETGKLFYYGDDSVKIYELPDIVVPEEHRQFIHGKASHFFAYTHTFNEMGVYSADITDFLNNFPSWSTVTLWKFMNRWDDDTWTEEEHTRFLDAITWFSEQKIGYEICWSY